MIALCKLDRLNTFQYTIDKSLLILLSLSIRDYCFLLLLLTEVDSDHFIIKSFVLEHMFL